MKTIKESIDQEIINGKWWELNSFFDKLGQNNVEESIKFLESIPRTDNEGIMIIYRKYIVNCDATY